MRNKMLKINMKQIYKIAGLILILLLAKEAYAQVVPKAVSLVSEPSSPSPGQTFTVTAPTPLFDKATSFFQWTINGAARNDFSGLGKNSFNLTAGNVGSVINVSVTVQKSEGGRERSSLVIPVSDLTLTWFADTYKPKWYKGKALPVQNSVVNVAALPVIILAGSRIDPEDLVYRWSLDDTKNALVGVGKQVFPIKLSPYTKNPVQVKVIVEDIDKHIKKEGTVFITPLEPHIVVYAFSPLGGVEVRNGAGFFASAKRGLLDFIVEPFFFPVSSRKDLLYEWRVENAAVRGSPLNPYILTIDTGKRPSGAIPLSVTVKTEGALTELVSKLATLFLQ